MKKEKAIRFLYFISIAFVITIAAFPPLVERIAVKFAREESIRITLLDGKAEEPYNHLLAISGWGYGNMDASLVNNGELESAFYGLDSEGFFYQAADPFFTNLLLSEKVGSFIEIKGKVVPNFWIALVKHPNAGRIQIEYGNEKNIISVQSEDGSKWDRVYIFEGDHSVGLKAVTRQLIVYAFIFTVLSLAIFASMRLIQIVLKWKLLYKQYDWKIGGIVCFTLLLIGGLLFRKLDSAFISFGDSLWYWNEANGAIVDGRLSLETYANLEKFTVRSYLPSFIALGCHVLAGWNESIAQILYIVFISAFVTVGIAYCIPQLYYMLTQKKANNLQMYLFVFLFIFFLHGLIYNCLTDIYALIFLCVFLFAFVKSLKEGRKRDLFLAGFCLGGIGLTRNNMIWGVYTFFIVLIVIYILLKLKRINKDRFQNITFTNIVLIFAGMLLICLPEATINYYRGVISLFEYDYVGVYNSPTQSLSVELLADALVGQQGWPCILKNVAGMNMVSDVYPVIGELNYLSVRHLQIADIAYIFLHHPIDTLISMLQKLFLYIDVKCWNIAPYGTNPFEWFSSTKYLLFSMFNHVLWSCGFSTVFVKKVRKKMFTKGEILIGNILLLLSFPLLFIHVEWRFLIILYMLVYYVVSFHLFEFFKDEENKEIRYRFLNSVILCTILLTVISSMLYMELQ